MKTHLGSDKINCLLLTALTALGTGCTSCHTPAPSPQKIAIPQPAPFISGKVETTPNQPYTLKLPLSQLPHPPDSIASASITGSNHYELTIYPGDGVVLRPDDAYSNPNTPDSPMSRLAEPATTPTHLILEFTSGLGGPVTWKICFSQTVHER